MGVVMVQHNEIESAKEILSPILEHIMQQFRSTDMQWHDIKGPACWVCDKQINLSELGDHFFFMHRRLDPQELAVAEHKEREAAQQAAADQQRDADIQRREADAADQREELKQATLQEILKSMRDIVRNTQNAGRRRLISRDRQSTLLR